MSRLSTSQLLADLSAAALHDPAIAARTRTAHRLVERATGEAAVRTGRVVAQVLDARLDHVLDRGWDADEVDRVVGLRAAGTVADQVLADRLAGRSGAAWWAHEWFAARATRSGAPEAVIGAAALLGVLDRLDPLPLFDPSASAVGDDGVLRKVRALLAKAESTTFADEAEALTAKAQELVTRHAIADLGVDPGCRGDLRTRRIALDAPYATAKSILLTAIARANRCRSVQCRFTETAVVFGLPADLDAVEVLHTSLLTQATSAMLAEGSVVDRAGRSRTRSFRRSFLIGFAQRIGARLAEAADRVVETAADPALVPALRARDDEVASAVRDAYPGLVRTRSSSSNLAGHLAGDVAGARADLAQPRVHGPHGRLTA